MPAIEQGGKCCATLLYFVVVFHGSEIPLWGIVPKLFGRRAVGCVGEQGMFVVNSCFFPQ